VPTVDAPVAEVTVFRSGARVLRRGQCQLDAGRQDVVVEGLPATLDESSVRAVVRGDGLVLLEVQVRRTFAPDPTMEQEAELAANVERARDHLQAVDDDAAAEQARLDFFGHLSEAAATWVARAVSLGRADHQEIAVMGDQLSSVTAAALGRQREIAVRRRMAQRQLDAAEARRSQFQNRSGVAVEGRDLVVTVEGTAATEASLECSYQVPAASWRPLYDLRLDGSTLRVVYLAEVTQRTGEDWPAVPVVLSTSRPGTSTGLPERTPWYVDRAGRQKLSRHRRPPAGTQPVMPMSAGAAPDASPPVPMAAPGAVPDPGGPAAPAPSLESELMEAELMEAGAALAYRVPRPLAVPTDGAPHKTTITELELEAELDHLAVPRLSSDVHLRATVTNTSPQLLLPGPVQVFHGSELVGATTIATVAPGEELEVHAGVDERVRVERKLARRSTSKAVLGGSRTVELAFELDVENHRDHPVQVTVEDQIPVSRDGDVKVRLREAVPKPVDQGELGELTWKLSLDAGGSATLRFACSIEHPAGTAVVGLGV